MESIFMPIKAWYERNNGLNSEEFEKDGIYSLLKDCRSNILITGAGGTGKSTILKKFQEKTKNTIVLSPTGIAASNINGQTIHSFFKLKLGVQTPENFANEKRDKRSKIYEKIDTIVIDEISMVRKDVFDVMDKIMKKYKKCKRPFGGAKLVMFGDMYQLPPVTKKEEQERLRSLYHTEPTYFFNSKIFPELDLIVLNLNEIYRQKEDKKYAEILNRMRKNEITDKDLEVINQRVTLEHPDKEPILSTKNNTVEAYNTKKLLELPGKTKVYYAEIKNPPHWPQEINDIKQFCNAEKELVLKEGARVVVIVNDISEHNRYVNGSLGTIKSMEEKSVTIQLDSGKEISIGNFTWEIIDTDITNNEIRQKSIGSISQIPLKLAWAMTIHRSQGQTLDKAYIDLTYAPWETGHAYVAFSRIKSLDGLKLKCPLRRQNILVDDVVLNWEKRLKEKTNNEYAGFHEEYITGLDPQELTDLLKELNEKIKLELGIEERMVMWGSPNSVLITNHPLLLDFIRHRIKILLKEIVRETRKSIYINKGQRNEEEIKPKKTHQEKIDILAKLFPNRFK
ncbi:AAA family ATPase [Patescibacteria group bacterium]|nr:AAA family ATPase [Patescibacteria group bacterium]